MSGKKHGLYKWSILIECDDKDMAEFDHTHYRDGEFRLKHAEAIGILRVDGEGDAV